MNRLFDVAQLLVASWSLAGDNCKLLTSHGVLDRALKAAIDNKTFPESFANEIHFAELRTGLRCVELPAILEWAQIGELTSAPNPSYQYAELKITPRVATVILRRLGVDPEEARALGMTLREQLLPPEILQEA